MKRILMVAAALGALALPAATPGEADAAWCVLPGQAGTECTIDGVVNGAYNATCDTYETARGRDSWYWFFC
ncbi:MAG: hypothetical protein HYU28_10895 [Actinobacteria bacterium]|nr:hypothetical protein [Actinomycetota bacterium]